jgi:hypothetical protein
VFLISSDASGEGMFISEVAMNEKHPGHIILRASKVIGTSRWDGSEYHLLYETPQSLMDFIDRIPVGIVIIDLSVQEDFYFEHHNLLIETIGQYSSRWEELGTFPMIRDGVLYERSLKIYRLIGHEGKEVGPIRINMQHMLNRDIYKP